jgi:tetratricopeptide (TPR) repeat protein
MNFFPSPYCEQPLSGNDFNRFSLPFSRILQKKIPTVSDILFIIKPADIKKYFHSSRMISFVRAIFLRDDKSPDRVCSHDNSFFLPFPLGEETVVAVIQGVDPFLVKKADHEWLIEIRNSALQEFARLKRERVDQDTGLLNTANLHDVLEILKDASDVTLILIELYPRVRSASEAILYSRKAALSLINFADYRFPVHYLGHGVFAVVTQHEKEESASRIGAMLISWLRRENFPRVHIGCSRNCVSATTIRPSLFDEAWQALQMAGKRGPFSFCDFSLLAHPEHHPLRQPSRQVLAGISRKWKNSGLFSIVQFQSDNSEPLDEYLTDSIDKVIVDGRDYYVFLEGMNSLKALAWARRKIRDIKKKIGKNATLSAGIGSYPLAGFSKKEVLHNCRKALLHAAFFGPDSMVVFDAVSLNISGDIFFSDGDLESALKEYKKGLVCDNDNINLLNSLGVTYAMMDRHNRAHQYFNRVLALDSNNFMALYNLGLGEVFLGHDESALVRFERAIAIHPDGSEDDSMNNDLQLQVGRLYCVTGAFQKAVDILLPWYENTKGTKNAGRAFRCLGKSFHGLNRKHEAMTWLQRALQFDQFDAETMGLLGEVYLEQGEGNEIALSLCEKSVELAPHNLRLRLGLAKAQTACRKYKAAREHLRLCLKNKETKAEAQLQNGLICLQEGRTKKAATWFTRVLSRNNIPPEIAQSARFYLEVNGR